MAELVPLRRAGAVPFVPGQTHCTIAGDPPLPGALVEISGAGATIETAARPPIGTRIRLNHDRAGAILGDVVGHTAAGIRLLFARDEAAVGFALAVVAAGLAAA